MYGMQTEIAAEKKGKAKSNKTLQTINQMMVLKFWTKCL